MALGVVAAIALLVSFPLPPRQLGDADAALAAAPACDPCPLPQPRPDELAVADQAGSHVVAGWLRRDDEQVQGTIRILDRFGKPSKAPFEILDARPEKCGTGCRRFTTAAADTLRVRLEEEGRPYVATLPAVWIAHSSRRAHRILWRAEATMSRLDSVRQVERITSGPRSHARTEYTLEAPDRMRFTTDRGIKTVTIGERQWMKTPDTPWLQSSYGSGIPFSLRQWFRWTPYATGAQVLASRREDRRPVTELALMDPATPVWYRLVVDDATNRVLRERMTARGHFMRTGYEAFNEDLRVRAPRSG